MKKAFSYLFSSLIFIAVVISTGCGGGDSSSTPTTPAAVPTSLIAKKVFVLNQFAGRIQIMDGATDTVSVFSAPASSLGALANATFMVRAGTSTLVNDQVNNSLISIDNAKEDTSFAVFLDGFTESIVVKPDNTMAYAAIPSLGRIRAIDMTKTALDDVPIDGIPGVRRLVISNDGATILAFSNNVDTLVKIKTSDKTISAPIGGFDRPYTAIFSSDSSKAFILSCGAECGGTTAKVTVLDVATGTLGASVVVGGATVGLLDGTNLYVAGSPGVSTSTTKGGRINIVNVGNTAAITTGAAVAISDGFHDSMALAGNGKVYIGAKHCRNIENGCLSFFNISAGTATIGVVHGDVTSIAPIPGRTVVYTTEGGELYIYSNTDDTLQAKQLDFLGKILDAKPLY